MTLLVASVLLAMIVGYAVIHPIIARRAALVLDTTAGSVLDAEARKRVALTELKEVEYDYLGGKLDEGDYRAMRERISLEALAAIEAVNAVQAVPTRSTFGFADEEGTDAAAVGHSCGWSNAPGSHFCGGCGQALT